jgi:predicted enzyme related to lactoylglutathione lyase
MKRVTGIGGIFFKSKDVPALKDWYKRHLGFVTTDWGATFVWGDNDPDKKGFSRTEWSPFGMDTKYLQPSTLPYMFNYRVHDLRALIDVLKSEGVQVVGDIDITEYGNFGWIMDPEGRKIELWEPVDGGFGDAPTLWTERVTGLGGVFFKSANPKAMKEWYKKHLDVADIFLWKDLQTPDAPAPAITVWCPFKEDTDYFDPSDKPWMFNYRVNDISSLIETLRSEGVVIAGEIQEFSYGKFAWILDLEGTKIELWEAKDDGFQ